MELVIGDGETTGWRKRAVNLALARLATAAFLLLMSHAGAAIAQAASKMPRVGYISPGSSSNQARVARLDAFRQGLREQGYVDGQNVVIDARWAQGSYDRYAELAAELVQANQLAEQAIKMRLPAIFGLKEHADAGGLVVYGADPLDMERRAAAFVVKILKGAKPADLPVEQPSKLELIINLKTAKAIGLTIPQSVLLRADQVIQ